MGGFLLFILLVPLILIAYLAIKHRNLLVSAYRIKQQYQEAQKKAEEEQERRERVRRHTEPAQSSIEMIDDATIDLDGGEYVEYEEIE